MLYKVKDFVNTNIIKSMYYAVFETYINYACIIWGQKITAIILPYILWKRHLQLSVLKSVMLTHPLSFITQKLSNCRY